MSNEFFNEFKTAVAEALYSASKPHLEQEMNEVTPEETAYLQSTFEKYDYFFTDPSIERWKFISETGDEIWRKGMGEKHLLYKWAIRKYYPDITGSPYDTPTEDDLDCELEEERLLSKRTVFDPNDLDKLWTLYHATGDKKYSNRIKDEITNPLANILVKGSASWSYNSHIQLGYLQDDDFEAPDPAQVLANRLQALSRINPDSLLDEFDLQPVTVDKDGTLKNIPDLL